MATAKSDTPANVEAYGNYIAAQKAWIEQEKKKLEEQLAKAKRDAKFWQAELKRKKDEERLWRQKANLKKEELVAETEKLRRMEALRASLVRQACEEDHKLSELQIRIEKVKATKKKHEKMQKDHLRKLLVHEGDPLEDDPTLVQLRKEIEELKLKKKRLDERDPLAMSILSGEATAKIKAKVAAAEAGLSKLREREKQLKLEMEAEKQKESHLDKKISELKVREEAEIKALEAELAELEDQIQKASKKAKQSSNLKEEGEDDVFDDDDVDWTMVPTQEQ